MMETSNRTSSPDLLPRVRLITLCGRADRKLGGAQAQLMRLHCAVLLLKTLQSAAKRNSLPATIRNVWLREDGKTDWLPSRHSRGVPRDLWRWLRKLWPESDIVTQDNGGAQQMAAARAWLEDRLALERQRSGFTHDYSLVLRGAFTSVTQQRWWRLLCRFALFAAVVFTFCLAVDYV